jgi:hypothetical protein
MTTPTKTAKRPLLTYFAVMASTTALLLCLLGCMLYLLFWLTLSPHEQFGIVATPPFSLRGRFRRTSSFHRANRGISGFFRKCRKVAACACKLSPMC